MKIYCKNPYFKGTTDAKKTKVVVPFELQFVEDLGMVRVADVPEKKAQALVDKHAFLTVMPGQVEAPDGEGGGDKADD